MNEWAVLLFVGITAAGSFWYGRTVGYDKGVDDMAIAFAKEVFTVEDNGDVINVTRGKNYDKYYNED